MKYLTAKEAAERWNISPRRVTLLASQGRIEGAVPPDSGWLIPETAPKPEDQRRKGAKALSNPEERYIFPFPLAVVNSEEQVESFTEEERELYRMNLAYEKGDFDLCRRMAEELVSSDNTYIRLGALYQLTFCSMYQGDFEATDRYGVLFRTVIRSVTAHKYELSVLLNLFDSELVSASLALQRNGLLDVASLPDELLPLIAAGKLFADLLIFNEKGTKPDIPLYEIICRQSEAQGYFFYAMYMHMLLSMYYGIAGCSEKELAQLRSAFRIALEHDMVFTMFFSIGFNPEASERVLSEYPPELQERYRRLNALFTSTYTAYARHRGIHSVVSQLTEDDYRLLSLCLKDYSVEQMAESFGLSKSGMNRRLSILYKKLGVKSKNELNSVYLQSVLDWKSN